jgi:primosomal protein N'
MADGVVNVLGPQPPVVKKIKGEYALVFLLKVPRSRPMSQVREILNTAIRTLLSDPAFKKVTITPDVDSQ